MILQHRLLRKIITVVTMVFLCGGILFSADAPKSGMIANAIISETASTLTCFDSDHIARTIKKNPARTIVHYISFINLWYQAGGSAVGLCDTKDPSEVPKEAQALPRTGHVTTPNVEKILSLEPTLVILSDSGSHRAIKDVLETSGVQTLLLSYNNYSDYLGILNIFFRLNGRDFLNDKSAKAIVGDVEKIAARTRAYPAPTFLSLFMSSRDIQAETDSANTAFMASYLGAKNIVASSSAPDKASRVTLSMERMHMENPDVILITMMGDDKALKEKMLKTMKESPAWQGLRAVDTGKIYFLPSDLFLYKANDRYPEAFSLIASYLYKQ